MNKLHYLKLLAVLCATGLFLMEAVVAGAQQAPRLDLKTTVQTEMKVKKQGKWVTETRPAEKTGPGDVLVYTIVYQNAGSSIATDARIVNPVPRGAALIPESIRGKDTEVACSIDNGATWHKPPVMIKIKNRAGVEEEKPAPVDRYTHVQWVIKKPVAPGQSGQVYFKATVK